MSLIEVPVNDEKSYTHKINFVIVTFVIVLPIFATGLWISAKFSLLERHFEVEVNSLSEDVKSKLNSNEIVLDGFSAFLKAVDSNDSESAERYAAFVASSYPQIYMLEVARKSFI